MPDELPSVVPCPVAEFARIDPSRPAVVSADQTISYAELEALVRQVEQGLVLHGIGVGSVVASTMPDSWRTAVLLWALLRLKACFVPLNTREPASRLTKHALRVGCDARIGDEWAEDTTGSILHWTDLEQVRGSESDRTAQLDLTARATVIFTSGSTGEGKGVVHSLRSHWYSALGSQASIPVGRDSRWLVVLPCFHVGGLSILFRSFIHGGTVLFAGRQGLADSIDLLSPTHVSLVATQLQRALKEDGGRRLSRLECVLVGGSFVPVQLVHDAVSAGIAVRKTYGLTEMASQVATTGRLGNAEELSTSGSILPYREIRIASDGELCVRGPTLFDGYVVDGGLETPFDEEGWFSTGDIGHIDENARLVVVGRKDAMFVSGGENIHPEEIEAAILATGLVDQVVVVPVEDETFGARPVAFVDPVPDREQLVSMVRSSIAGFKVPVRVLALPSNAGIKPDRSRLKTLASQEPENF